MAGMTFARALGAATFGLISSAGAHADNDAAALPPPCSDLGYTQLDFWVGDWVVEWDGPNGTTQSGRNVIAKTLGGCAIDERFQTDTPPPFVGRSLSTYAAARGLWLQTWMDNAGGYYVFEGDLTATPPALYEVDAPDPSTQRRMVWEDISADGLVWRWQSRPAGDRDAAWTDVWIIRYARAD